MSYDTIASVRYIISILKYLGLWRLDVNSCQLHYILYARILHFSLSFPYTLMMWIDVIQAQDLEKFSNTMYMSLTELALIAKIINIWQHSKDAWNFFATITQDELFALRTAEEQKHWSHVMRRYRFISFMYFFMSITTISIAFVAVLFRNDYELPFAYRPPFDWRNEQNYWYAYFFELLAMPVTCLSNCALDMITCYMLLHLSQCYKLIGMRLERLGYVVEMHGGLAPTVDEQHFQLELIQISKMHQSVKHISKQCEAIVSNPFMLQIMCSSFVLCFSAYRLQQVRILENPSQFFVLILAVAVMILQIFIPCYFGNEITFNSNALTFAIYKSKWFQQSASVRKFIFLNMEFLKKPVKIRIGNFFDIGLPLFTRIINNAYSLMALLLNFNK